jgi:site-specific recombinase XerC
MTTRTGPGSFAGLGPVAVSGATMKIEQALEHFLVQLEADGRSAHTIGQYRRHIALLARWITRERGDVGGDEITHEDLARFLASSDARQRGDGRSKKAGSANALRTSLRVFFRYVHEAGYAPTNPARLIRRAICGRPPPRGLSDAEAERLMDVLILAQGPEARRDHLLYDLMLSTGVRLSAALALDAADVDLDRSELIVRHAKGNREERVILGRGIKDHLIGFLAGRPPGPLFTDRRGRRISTRQAQRRLAQWLAKAGCQPRSPHSLRHSFAQRLYRRTGDVLLVGRALGHLAVTSTMVYAQADVERLKEVLAG